jgi:cytosine/adenosine deaminase-related metal-dependent hydrolase
MPVLVLRAGVVFDGEVRRSGADVLVEGGRAVAVEDSAPPPSDAELVDLGAGVMTT